MAGSYWSKLNKPHQVRVLAATGLDVLTDHKRFGYCILLTATPSLPTSINLDEIVDLQIERKANLIDVHSATLGITRKINQKTDYYIRMRLLGNALVSGTVHQGRLYVESYSVSPGRDGSVRRWDDFPEYEEYGKSKLLGKNTELLKELVLH